MSPELQGAIHSIILYTLAMALSLLAFSMVWDKDGEDADEW